jgi:hypothetical protein
LREILPPRGRGSRGDEVGIPDYSFGFQLCPERNPNTVGRVNFRRYALCSDNDGGKISEQILADSAASEMLSCVVRERT